MEVKFFHEALSKGLVCTALLIVSIVCALIPSVCAAQQKVPSDLFSVTFVNGKEGWSCGRWGTIIHTSDGGRSWNYQKSTTDYTLSSIFFADSHHGWAVGDDGTIVHTEDGGETWTKQDSPAPVFLMAVTFVSPRKGWAVGERTTILHTEDGGKTWAVQFSGEDFILRALSFADEMNGWAVGEYGFIYNTKNGGKTWSKQAGSFELSVETGQVLGGNYLFGVSAMGKNTAWAVGIEGHVVRTTNGGQAWQTVAVNTKTHLFAVAADSSGRVLIAGKGLLSASLDRGTTWQQADLTPPVTYSWIQSLAPRGQAGFAAVGGKGFVYLADKKGLIWHRVTY